VPFVERQLKFLSEFKGPAYLRQVRRWLRTLSDEPRLRPLLADMGGDALRLIQRYSDQDTACVKRLCTIRELLITRGPASDDSATPKPLEEQLDREYKFTFAYFNEIVAEKPRLIAPLAVEDNSRTAELLSILTVKLERLMYPHRDEQDSAIREKQERPDLVPLYMELMTVRDQHQYEHNIFLDEMLTDAGFYLLTLKNILTDLNPEPQEVKTPEDLAARWDEQQFALANGTAELREDLYSARARTDLPAYVRAMWPRGIAPGKVERLAADLPPYVSRVHEDLIRRIGTRRSLLALLHRFKERCRRGDGHVAAAKNNRVVPVGRRDDDHVRAGGAQGR
jgi:hypothetical protein